MALSTFTDLKAELANQGFDYLTSTQQGDYVNAAYQEVCSLLPWPFLETNTTTLTSGTSVSDLRQVLTVTNAATDAQLAAADRRWLVSQFGDLSDTGTAMYWYLDGGTTIRTYPVDTAQFTVYYIKTPTALSSGSDTPLVPSQWRLVLVHGAKCIAHLENGNYEAEQQARVVWQAYVDRMAAALLGTNNTATPQVIVQTDYKNY